MTMTPDPDPENKSLFAELEGIFESAVERGELDEVTDFSELTIPELITRRVEAASELDVLGDLKRIQVGKDPVTERGRELASYHTAICVALSNRGIE